MVTLYMVAKQTQRIGELAPWNLRGGDLSRVLPASHPKAAGIGFIPSRYLIIIIYEDDKTILVYIQNL